MDWTGYPIAIAPDVQLVEPGDLARFLGGTADGWVHALLGLIEAADSDDRDRLALAFPRESLAYGTWKATTPEPTGAQLADILSQIPDTPVETPVELLPVQIDRVLIYSLPATSEATVTIKHRADAGQPWRTATYRVPTPAVDVDPALLQTTDGACLALRLTVQDDA